MIESERARGREKIEINERHPCRENDETIGHLRRAIGHLRRALEWQCKRTRDRGARGVEGTGEA